MRDSAQPESDWTFAPFAIEIVEGPSLLIKRSSTGLADSAGIIFAMSIMAALAPCALVVSGLCVWSVCTQTLSTVERLVTASVGLVFLAGAGMVMYGTFCGLLVIAPTRVLVTRDGNIVRIRDFLWSRAWRTRVLRQPDAMVMVIDYVGRLGYRYSFGLRGCNGRYARLTMPVVAGERSQAAEDGFAMAQVLAQILDLPLYEGTLSMKGMVYRRI